MAKSNQKNENERALFVKKSLKKLPIDQSLRRKRVVSKEEKKAKKNINMGN